MTEIRLFTTIPPAGREGGDYRQVVRRAARLSEAVGFVGALVYSDNNTVDPWAVAQEVLVATDALMPLVALQPVYQHPYTVAKTISSYGVLYGRRICLNLVAGGSRSDLAALDDFTKHDERYVRLTEYAQLVGKLLAGRGPVTHDGDHYRVQGLNLHPGLPEHLAPELFMSGSSPAGRRAAEVLGALPVRYPEPPGPDGRDLLGDAVRIGVIARDTDEEAWQAAHDRFPNTRAGRMLQRMARHASDSQWVERLSEAEEFPGGPDSPYWMGPFKNYTTFCPYLVGNHDKVATELTRYFDQGCHTFILDTSRDEADYADAAAVFAHAQRRRGQPTPVTAGTGVAAGFAR